MDILIPVIIIAVIGLIAGLGLSFASKYMAVPVDETEVKLREVLPGANCGACGFSGCDGYAAALAKGEAKPNLCSPGGDTTAKAIGEILKVEVEANPKIALIACNNSCDKTKRAFAYEGLQSCTAAALLQGGPLDCKYGCIGLLDCLNACPFNAIIVNNGHPTVCGDLCKGCGLCVNTCPKDIIKLVPKDYKTAVLCNNKEKGAPVVQACQSSCLACTMCERTCEKGAIKVIDNLAQIDYELCDGCGKCKEVCKRKVII